jgi:inner membrane transporter RhtA
LANRGLSTPIDGSIELATRTGGAAVRAFRAIPPPVLVMSSMMSLQVGAAFAKKLFGIAGPAGVVSLRLGFAALILLVVCRPSWRLDRRTLGVVAAFGVVLAGMNVLIYHAFARIPLGAAVTFEFVGPLAVAVFGSRRKLDLLWAALAGAGVCLLSKVDGGMDVLGVGFALSAGALWAAYILIARKVGKHTSGGSGLALSMTFGALVAVPFGAVEAGPALVQPPVLLVGLVVAVMSSVIPYSFELEALRHIPARVFGVLMSLEPGFGALAGLVVLHEALGPMQWLAIGSVVLASIGATRSSSLS